MSHDTFDLGWLRLREPLDEAARAVELTWAFGRRLPRHPQLIDLGSGSGSNLRHLAQRIGRAEQDWVLFEKDMKLLSKAPGEIARWAARSGHAVTEERRAFSIRSDELAVRAEMRVYDLSRDLSGLGLNARDGVTASALLDLVSAAWMDRFADELASAGYPLVLLALTIDGRVAFEAADGDDRFVMDLIDAHMASDKGFGPALGGSAPAAAASALQRVGYRVETARADWRVGPRQKAAHLALLAGYEGAAVEQDPAARDRIQAWAGRRRALAEAGGGMTVGHVDILAYR